MPSMDRGSMRMHRVEACASGSGVLAVVDKMQVVTRRSLRLACAAAMAAVVGLSAGCTSPKMPVPAELAQVSEELPVIDRSRFGGLPGVDESFLIGSYEIAEVDRDAQVSIGGSVPGFAKKHVTGGYSYVFRGSNDERRGECAIDANKTRIGAGLPVSMERNSGTLGCVCRGSESESNLTVWLSYTEGMGSQSGEQWVLGGGSVADGDFAGELQAGGRSFEIRMISRTEMKGKTYVAGEGWKDTVEMTSWEPTGGIVYGDGPEAGLELLHPGRVWLGRSLEPTEREDMACLLGALLLYDSP